MRRVNGNQNGQAIRASCAIIAGMRQIQETVTRGFGIEKPQSVNMSEATTRKPVKNARFAAVVRRATSSTRNATALHASSTSNVSISGSAANSVTTATNGIAVNHRRSNEVDPTDAVSTGASYGLCSMVIERLTEGFYDTALNEANDA